MVESSGRPNHGREQIQEPDNLICPITFTMFQDPVVVQSGNTYERLAIEEYWRNSGCLRDPLTNQILSTAMVFPNLDKRRDVWAFLQQHHDYTPKDWLSREPSPQALLLPTIQSAQHERPLGHDYLRLRLVCTRYAYVALGSVLAIMFVGSLTKRFISRPIFSYRSAEDPGPWSLLSFMADLGLQAFRRLKIMSFGGLSGVIQTMQKYPQDLEIQQQCSQVLASFSVNPQHQESIAALGGIRLLLEAMKIHSGARDVHLNCVVALKNLAYHVDNQVAIALFGGIQLFIHIMQRYFDDLELVEQVAWALGNLALNHQNGASMSALGGIEQLLATMRAHIDVSGVQRECGRALGNLAMNYRSHEQLASLGTIEVLLLAMSGHPRDHGVQRQCAWALGNLAKTTDNQASIASTGGIEVILAAMERHPHEAEMLWECSRALGNLATHFDILRSQIGAKGGIEVMLKVMEGTHREGALQEQILYALYHLALNAHNMLRIQANDGVKILLQAKLSHSESPILLEEVDKVLRQLPLAEDAQRQLQSHGESYLQGRAHPLPRGGEL